MHVAKNTGIVFHVDLWLLPTKYYIIKQTEKKEFAANTTHLYLC